MKNFLILLASILCISLPCFSQDTLSAVEKEIAYNKTIDTRSQKIVANLGIADAAKAAVVKNIIADQYKNLNKVYEDRDLKIKATKAQQTSDNKEAINDALDRIKDETTAKTAALHNNFLAQLGRQLNAEQVDKVKDGMTYNVLHVTYNGYNQMITNLTPAQQQQIMVWLTEAREYAMDAESSEKKHAWFGKYKGRINNYLSKEGYDLQKEGVEWQKRIKEEAEKKNAAN